MDTEEINDIVENFKGLTWDELDDALTGADVNDLKNLLRMLQIRFGMNNTSFSWPRKFAGLLLESKADNESQSQYFVCSG